MGIQHESYQYSAHTRRTSRKSLCSGESWGGTDDVPGSSRQPLGGEGDHSVSYEGCIRRRDCKASSCRGSGGGVGKDRSKPRKRCRPDRSVGAKDSVVVAKTVEGRPETSYRTAPGRCVELSCRIACSTERLGVSSDHEADCSPRLRRVHGAGGYSRPMSGMLRWLTWAGATFLLSHQESHSLSRPVTGPQSSAHGFVRGCSGSCRSSQGFGDPV